MNAFIKAIAIVLSISVYLGIGWSIGEWANQKLHDECPSYPYSHGLTSMMIFGWPVVTTAAYTAQAGQWILGVRKRNTECLAAVGDGK